MEASAERPRRSIVRASTRSGERIRWRSNTTAGSGGRMADGLSLGRGLADVHLEAVARSACVQRDDGRLARGEPVSRYALGVRHEHLAGRVERALAGGQPDLDAGEAG